jgi:hypothetical protein
MIRKILLIGLCLFTGLLNFAYSEEKAEPARATGNPYVASIDNKTATVSARAIIDRNLEPSYITAGGGISISSGRDGYGNWDAHLFEAELNHHLHFFDTPGKWGWNGFMKVNTKIQLRMFNEESAPVKTPGFLPRATYFFWLTPVEKGHRFEYYSVMLSHHSNGQAGDFYNADGTINTDSGSFSTNYFEFANYQYKHRYLPEWTKFALQWHPGFNREDKLKDQYEDLKVEVSARTTTKTIASIFPKAGRWITANKWQVKLFGTLSYVVHGREYITAPNAEHPEIRPEKADWTDNFNTSLHLSVRPPQFNDMSLFIKHDFGYDYYNINFRREFNRIQFGIAGDPFGILD